MGKKIEKNFLETTPPPPPPPEVAPEVTPGKKFWKKKIVLSDYIGTSQIGFAELSRPGDKYTGQELVSVLRLNKTKTLQLLAVNKMGKGKFGSFFRFVKIRTFRKHLCQFCVLDSSSRVATQPGKP